MNSVTNSITNLLINITTNTNSSVDASLDAALANLADISVGQTPSIWPLAWGWWVLILLVVVIIFGTFWIATRYFNKHKLKRSALKAIENISHSESQALSKLHAILRSAVMHYFPFENLNSLRGLAWQERLQVSAKQNKQVDEQCLLQLTQLEASLYTKKPSISVDDAKNAVYLWIKHCLPPASAELQNTETSVPSRKGDKHV
nr:DUF4381 domain-containing protein [uncultured Glaciecola sp.]